MPSSEARLVALAALLHAAAFAVALRNLRRGEGAEAASRARGLESPILTVLALGANVVVVALRSHRLGDHALADLPTTLLLLTACCTLVGLVVDALSGLRALPVFLAPLAAGAMAVSTLLEGEGAAVKAEGAAAVLLRTHIATAFVAYASFALAALLGLMYLLLLGALRRKRLGTVSRGLPPLERLDRLALGSLTTGAGLLAVSLSLGVLAQSASGVLGPNWLTDSKTLFGFGTLLAAGAIAALRRGAVFAGRAQALAVVLVFGLALFTYLGTPLLLGSSHPRG